MFPRTSGRWEGSFRAKPTLLLAFAFLIAAGCGEEQAAEEPGPQEQATVSVAAPKLGDTKTRAADAAVMNFVPAGQFMMGSSPQEVDLAVELCNRFVANCQPEWFQDEMPAHAVALAAFWIDRTEVTNGQYTRCVAAGGCNPPKSAASATRPSYYGNTAFTDYPVIDITSQDAAAYCTWAGAGLPTEGQWEYAARGPDARRYPWGNDFDGSRLNYCDANCTEPWNDAGFNDARNDTAPVGSYPTGASWCGALDMAGNVWEYVADWYAPYAAASQSNPTGPPTGTVRMVRGGSWDHEPCDARSAYRTWFDPADISGEWEITPGFRCAQSAVST